MNSVAVQTCAGDQDECDLLCGQRPQQTWRAIESGGGGATVGAETMQRKEETSRRSLVGRAPLRRARQPELQVWKPRREEDIVCFVQIVPSSAVVNFRRL